MPATDISVAGNFFHVLGVSAELGRTFTNEESRTRRRSPVDPRLLEVAIRRQTTNIVGKTITLNDKPVTVVGVLP